MMPDAVLSIRDLRVYFNIRSGTVRAVDGGLAKRLDRLEVQARL